MTASFVVSSPRLLIVALSLYAAGCSCGSPQETKRSSDPPAKTEAAPADKAATAEKTIAADEPAPAKADAETTARRPAPDPLPAGTKTYRACGCGCCEDEKTPRDVTCLGQAEFDKRVADDREGADPAACASIGCSAGQWFAVC